MWEVSRARTLPIPATKYSVIEITLICEAIPVGRISVWIYATLTGHKFIPIPTAFTVKDFILAPPAHVISISICEDNREGNQIYLI